MVSASTSYLEVMVLMLLFRFLAPSSLSLRSAPAPSADLMLSGRMSTWKSIGSDTAVVSTMKSGSEPSRKGQISDKCS